MFWLRPISYKTLTLNGRRFRAPAHGDRGPGRLRSSLMSDTAAEPIQVGALTVRFHVDADESGGSVSVFECDVPADARMPAPHSHNEFDETVFGLDVVATFPLGGARSDLNPGEALFIPRRVI